MPKRFPLSSVLRYALVQSLVLLVGLPLAAIGSVAWYLPYLAPRLSLKLYRPAYEVVATVKLATSLLVFPITYALWLAAAWLLAGLVGLVAMALVLPVTGLVALRWRDRWRIVREDTRVFWRAVRRRTLREELVSRRQALVSEFDLVARRWQQEQGVRRGSLTR